MKKLIFIFLIIASVALVGCGELYTIDPDIKDTSSPKITVNVQSPDEEEAITKVEQQDNQEATDQAQKDAEAQKAADLAAQEAAQKAEEKRLAEEEQRNEIVNDLFVNQFSSDKPYDLEVDVSELSNEAVTWSFKRNTDHSAVTGFQKVDLSLFDSYFIKDTTEKVMYLTFDEGYEEGYTPKILDILKDNNVKATFFITGYYLKSQPDLVKRMLAEGHIVANHSVNHPAFPTLTDEEVYNELADLAKAFKDVTGQEMAPFFRPPSANYSERILYLARKLGYRTIFYSMAYGDWNTDDQPGRDVAYDHVMSNYHDGAIILLHAVSKSNTEALDDILRDLKALGYRFGSLYELE